MSDPLLKISPKALFSRESWRLLKRYIRPRRAPRDALDHPDALGEFIASRASHVAQSALYGYMKTRAGTRFPELFEDPAMLASINIAKWQVWLACLSDLAVYSGVLLRARSGASAAQVEAQVARMVARALAQVGAPPDAGDHFAAAARAVEARIQAPGWAALGDDDSAFTESPRALVQWAPVADALKCRDRAIVRNSVRFRWQEVRRDLRKRLRAEAVMAHAPARGETA